VSTVYASTSEGAGQCAAPGANVYRGLLWREWLARRGLVVGALAGRYYFQRRFGAEAWTRYVPVIAAGFSCGAGLAGMAAVALSLIVECAKELPF